MSSFNLGGAFLELSMRGHQGVQSALAQMRQQFQQTIAPAQALINLLNAGPGSRLAQRQLELQALRSRAEAAGHGAMTRAMLAPRGQAALQQTVAAESDSAVSLTQQRSVLAQMRAAYAESQPGRQNAAAQAAAEAETRLAEARQRNATLAAQVTYAESQPGKATAQAEVAQERRGSILEMRERVTRMEAQARHAGTPQGRAEMQEMASLRNRGIAAQEYQRRQQVLAEQGRLVGGLQLAGEGLQKFGRTMAPVIAGLSTAAALTMELGGKASPAHAATVSKSMDLVMAKLGSAFVPALEGAARALQSFANLQDEVRNRGIVGGVQGYLNRTEPQNARGETPGVAASILASGAAWAQTGFQGALRELGMRQGPVSYDLNRRQLLGALGYTQPPKEQERLKREYPGAYQSRFTSFEEYGRSLQLAATNQSELDAARYQEQVRNFLQNGGELLQRIDQNLGELNRNFRPAWGD